jgi:hypothetical protein
MKHPTACAGELDARDPLMSSLTIVHLFLASDPYRARAVDSRAPLASGEEARKKVMHWTPGMDPAAAFCR